MLNRLKYPVQLYLMFIALISLNSAISASERIKGYVYDKKDQPIIGANIFWENTNAGTSSDLNGYFEIDTTTTTRNLKITYIGYTPVVIYANHTNEILRITLNGEVELDEVVVSERKTGTITSRLTILQTQKITTDELLRAACCNLAESFETNPSVDVSYSDAATGARQIKLLGLSGTYTQMLTENYPNFRGAASLYGLDYIPGPWMESIQISKGTSSVKNGYEALAGQINVEFKKPATADPFSLNLFGSDAGRYEGNADAAIHINNKVSTGLFVHYSKNERGHDANKDGFLDIPLTEQVNVMNRWSHQVNRYVAQYGVRYINDSRSGGQTSMHHPITDPYTIDIQTNRGEFFTKQALILNTEKAESIALILSNSYHEQKSIYDRTNYNVYQKNSYASLLYEKAFSPSHQISSGLSMNYDGFNENVAQNNLWSPSNRTETVSGAYVQYTYNLNNKLILLGGIRADYSSMFDLFVTPRLHIKYNPFDWLHIRSSVGKGYRTANVLTENNFLLSSSRKMMMHEKLEQEEAWNTGLNISFYIPLFDKELMLTGEWYYTHFLQQAVVDVDSDAHSVSFYNLKGNSFSNSVQIEATYPLFRGFSITSAYRYIDTQTDYQNAKGETYRLKKPLTSKFKGLVTASYQTPLKKWQFDVTTQFNGGGRMPTPDASTPMWDTHFKSHSITHLQATKFFRNWSIYLGSENLFDFKQTNPIIDASNPRGANFDASMIWGPVHGRKIYAGIRFNISKD